MTTTATPTGETLAERFDREAGRESLDRIVEALDKVAGSVGLVEWCVKEGEAVLWHASGDGPSARGGKSSYLSEKREDLPVVTAEMVGTLKLFADEVLEASASLRKDALSILEEVGSLYHGSNVATEQMTPERRAYLAKLEEEADDAP